MALPTEADGLGVSMGSTYITPKGTPDSPLYWRGSIFNNGSPFADDTIKIIESIANNNLNLIDFKVYPNPSSQYINIQLQTDKNIIASTVELYDYLGNLIFNDQLYNKSYLLDLESLNILQGIYILKVRLNDQIKVERVIFIPN